MHNFQQHLVNEIKSVLTDVQKMIYFSDGASSQYKNKNFVNVSQHQNDFGIPAD